MRIMLNVFEREISKVFEKFVYINHNRSHTPKHKEENFEYVLKENV